MKNIIIMACMAGLFLFTSRMDIPPSLYDLANREAIKLTGCGISDIKEAVKTETGYKVLVVSECGKEDFIIVIDHIE